MSKYAMGNFTIKYFDNLNQKIKKKSKNFESQGLAKISAEKWKKKHGGSYIIRRVIYNSLYGSKWDPK